MNAEVKPAKHSAPGQYLGYALQPVRVFYHLLTCPDGAKVSLEYQDDVAVHYADGSLCLEQTKSALKQNPVSDWAIDLWKAFDNWLAMLEAGNCKAGETQFRIYVTPAKTDALVESLSQASTPEQLKSVVDDIRKKLARRKNPPACSPHLERFLNASDEERNAIAIPFKLTGDTEPLDAIRELISHAVPEQHVDLIVRSGIGQAKQAVDRLIQHGAVPILDADTFKKDFKAFVRQNNLPGLLVSFADVPDASVVASVASSRPTFIRQLEWIQASEDDRLRAVSDYLRTSADKADWAESGLIFSGSLDTWDHDLVHQHALMRGDVTDLHSDKSAEAQGRILYRQSARHQAPLEGRVVPSHFVHGSFNDLADRRRLGWHPDYAALIDGEEA